MGDWHPDRSDRSASPVRDKIPHRRRTAPGRRANGFEWGCTGPSNLAASRRPGAARAPPPQVPSTRPPHAAAHAASLLCAAIAVAAPSPRDEPAVPVVLGNELVRVEAWIAGARLHESYLARRNGQWVPVAADADGGTAGASALDAADGSVVAGTGIRLALENGALVEEWAAGGRRALRTVSLCPEGPWLRVTTRLQPAPGPVHAFADRFRFARQPDWSFAPSVGGFVPDAQYKAPLILVQSDRTAFGIVPDLAALDAGSLRRCNHALDLDVPGGPSLAVGFVPARFKYHSVYAEDPGRSWQADTPVENSYFLLVTATADPGGAYREAVRLHWSRFGRPAQRSAAAQQVGTGTDPGAYRWMQKTGPVDLQIAEDRRIKGLALWDDWRGEVWEAQSRHEWLAVPLPGGAVGGGVRTLRWGPGPSVYLSSWFNTLRTSFGMALYARREGKEDLLGMARRTVEVALRAPGRDGAFKCIAVPAGGGWPEVWAAGDGSGDSTKEGYLGYDMSWTAYWLLRWRAAGLPESGPILARCRALAEFLVGRQSADGMLPTRFAEDGSVVADVSRTVKAETGPVALFLLELYSQDADPRWLRAAGRGLAFLEGSVIPGRQWYDYETFWSCSPRGPELDRRSGQWPANDLALGQAVAAYLSMFRATGDRACLDRGERLLDYLLLYQQCWTNPLLRDLTGPAMLLGGFTTQKSDAEWSDARQSQFGNVLLDYYRATGRAEYLERGVAALRAQFPISPSENWAHEGYGTKSGISSFHWGTGSGMAGIEIDEDYLRDAVVDVAAGLSVGVNGIDVTQCTVGDGEVRLSFTSSFAWRRPPVFAFHRCDPKRRYRVVANGAELGSWPGDALERGIPVPLSAAAAGAPR